MEIVDENKSVRWPQYLAVFAGKNCLLKIRFLEVLMKFYIQANIGTFSVGTIMGWPRYFAARCVKSTKIQNSRYATIGYFRGTPSIVVYYKKTLLFLSHISYIFYKC
jgi:hypothetical protein